MAENKLFSTTLPLRILEFLGKHLPHSVGYFLARQIGALMSWFPNSRIMKAVRSNQSVIHNNRLTEKQLNILCRKVMQLNACMLFDFFYYLPRPQLMLNSFTFEPETLSCIERIRSGQPVVVVAPHLSNFDLTGQVLGKLGLDIQVLSYPNPNPSYQYQNYIRQQAGLNVIPISPQALKAARKHLQAGGCVITGMDRPIENDTQQKYRPLFFGKPASLPVLHIRLAMELDVPVAVFACYYESKGRYVVKGSQLHYMKQAGNLVDAVVMNTEVVLKDAERFISEAPDQWLMFYPVWPEASKDS